MRRTSRRILFGQPHHGRGRASLTRKVVGVLVVSAFVFAGDVVRLHGHADPASSSDCAACTVNLPSFRDAPSADPSPSIPAPSFEAGALPEIRFAPRSSLRRVGGLRDPPVPVSR